MKETMQDEVVKFEATEMKMMISICCLVYNHEQYLRECFDGFVLQKTTFPIEILVHDDASTDHSADIIREYTQKYPDLFKPIYQMENQYSKGVDVFSINVKRAKGKYIALCEGDDYWTDPLKLQKQVEFLENNPIFSMCFHRAKILYESQHGGGLHCVDIEDREYAATELFSTWLVSTASMLFRKSCLAFSVKGAERILNGDIVLVEQCAHTGLIRGMSFFGSIYRVHSQGVTYCKDYQKTRILKYPEHLKCIEENFPKIEKDVLDKCKSESYNKRYECVEDARQKKEDYSMIEQLCPGYWNNERKRKRRMRISNLIKKIFRFYC